MRKLLRRIGKILLILFCVIIAFLAIMSSYHHIALGIEAGELEPNGTLVEVNGHQLHVYAEGEKSEKPTLVFMSGSATVAPVYDFKSLYSLLSDEYRIAVIEKAGYGYSDICEVDRDIDTMLDETRQALSLAGESGPYVLLPHSMSGLEAIYWAQTDPDEIKAIIGLDMAVPESYDFFDFSINTSIYIGHALVWMGLHRIVDYPLDTTALTDFEIEQQRLLMYRNAVNSDYILEGKAVCGNAQKVKAGGRIDVPMLMFVSKGEGLGDNWISIEEKFATENGAQLIPLNCSHYVHNDEYERIAEEILDFLSPMQ